MTRPIKFRAWNVNGGGFSTCELSPLIAGATFTGDYHGSIGPWEQFTGLKDKNGVDIYEGDILENGGDPLAVRYGEISVDGFADYTEKAVGFCLGGANYGNPHPELKVIGNVHQNHELLNGTSR